MPEFISLIGEVFPGIVAVIVSLIGGKYGGDSVKKGFNGFASIMKEVDKAVNDTSQITTNNGTTDPEPYEVSEDTLLKLAAEFKGYKYTKKGEIPTYPFDYPWRNKKAEKDPNRLKRTNCSTFAASLLAQAWLDKYEERGFQWDIRDHNDMMILCSDIFSSVNCPVRKNMAKEVLDSRDIVQPESWTVVQGWNESRTVGHCFLIWKVDDDDGNAKDDSAKILTLESNNEKSGIDGVGFKGIGKIVRKNIDRQDRLSPPDNWQNKNVPTWGDLKDAYPDMKLAKLNVIENEKS